MLPKWFEEQRWCNARQVRRVYDTPRYLFDRRPGLFGFVVGNSHEPDDPRERIAFSIVRRRFGMAGQEGRDFFPSPIIGGGKVEEGRSWVRSGPRTVEGSWMHGVHTGRRCRSGDVVILFPPPSSPLYPPSLPFLPFHVRGPLVTPQICSWQHVYLSLSPFWSSPIELFVSKREIFRYRNGNQTLF